MFLRAALTIMSSVIASLNGTRPALTAGLAFAVPRKALILEEGAYILTLLICPARPELLDIPNA